MYLKSSIFLQSPSGALVVVVLCAIGLVVTGLVLGGIVVVMITKSSRIKHAILSISQYKIVVISDPSEATPRAFAFFKHIF